MSKVEDWRLEMVTLAKKLNTNVSEFTNDRGRIVEVYLYRTQIVRIEYGDMGTVVIFDHGGWPTVTTRRRMNQAMETYGLPLRVHQKDHDQFVTNLATQETFEFEGNSISILA